MLLTSIGVKESDSNVDTEEEDALDEAPSISIMAAATTYTTANMAVLFCLPSEILREIVKRLPLWSLEAFSVAQSYMTLYLPGFTFDTAFKP
ncbi:hypothetical protein HK100_002003 [Physocladia obscura]|uniref:F-box domain-containing protein n=1 Tax=Physocladia obscura TaxID=109957 RepID=A0AAD5XEH8_9FUNG|nr:hypothetical protein HK100_002003 [Physocladia obscura]